MTNENYFSYMYLVVAMQTFTQVICFTLNELVTGILLSFLFSAQVNNRFWQTECDSQRKDYLTSHKSETSKVILTTTQNNFHFLLLLACVGTVGCTVILITTITAICIICTKMLF